MHSGARFHSICRGAFGSARSALSTGAAPCAQKAFAQRHGRAAVAFPVNGRRPPKGGCEQARTSVRKSGPAL
eukprot:9985442-Alexandrium_andersonii.AAC.1